MSADPTPAPDFRPPRPARLRTVLLGAAILFCGAVIGSAVTTGLLWKRLSRDLRHPPVISERVADRIIERYDLPQDLRGSLAEVLERHRGDVEAVRDSLEPMMDSLRVQFREDIAAVLPDDLAERWRADFDSDFERWGPPGGRRDGRGPQGPGRGQRHGRRQPPPPPDNP